MNLDDYNALPEEEQKEFHTERVCECGANLIGDGHSTGDLHVICPKCRMCPDCEDGAC